MSQFPFLPTPQFPSELGFLFWAPAPCLSLSSTLWPRNVELVQFSLLGRLFRTLMQAIIILWRSCKLLFLGVAFFVGHERVLLVHLGNCGLPCHCPTPVTSYTPYLCSLPGLQLPAPVILCFLQLLEPTTPTRQARRAGSNTANQWLMEMDRSRPQILHLLDRITLRCIFYTSSQWD